VQARRLHHKFSIDYIAGILFRQLPASLLLAVADLEDVLQHDDFEDLVDLVATAEDGDGAAVASEANEEPDEGADSGTGDDRDIGEPERRTTSPSAIFGSASYLSFIAPLALPTLPIW
jgi:hypothetical protein